MGGPDAEEAARRYAKLAATYDRRVRLVGRLRRAAVHRLQLHPDDHVLDIGCGTGASFARLEDAVGADGRITGIELSDEMAAIARNRATQHGWSNIEVVVGDAASAPLPQGVDGALFFLVHDLLRSPTTLKRVVAACRPGAKVVAFGPRWTHGWARPLNALVRRLARPYVTTFEGFDKPWEHLEPLLHEFHVRDLTLGTTYLAQGRVAR